MRCSRVQCFVVGMVAYVYGVYVVVSSRTSPPPPTTTTTTCGLTKLDDVESRTVDASIVVDAVVNNLRRIERTSSGVVLYDARLTVIHVLKGRLERTVVRPRAGRMIITVGTFARSSRRAGTASTATPNVDELCASSDLPMNGSRYIVFLHQPTSLSAVARASLSSRSLVYSISSSPEPFSANTLNVIRHCSRRRYGMIALQF